MRRTFPFVSNREPPESKDALTGLRFLAALHVLFFHFGGGWFAHAPSWLQAIQTSGYASVGLFYVLSGFVLAYKYLGAESQASVDPKRFWLARFARVYPVYFLSLLLSAPFVLANSLAANPPAVAAGKLAVGGGSAALLVQAWLPKTALYWNPPGWSVAVEAFFYLVFPWCAVRAVRVRKEKLLGAMAVVWAAGLVPSALYLALHPEGLAATHTSGDAWLAVLKFNPLLRLPEFVLGVLLGRLFALDEADAAPGRATEAPAGSARTGLFLAPLAAGAVLVAFAASEHLPYALLHNALLSPLYAALVYGLARGGGPLGRGLASRPMTELGAASYSLYILQYPLSEGLRWLAERLQPAVDFAAPRPFFVLFLVAALGLSVASFRLVEAPLRAWLRRRLSPATP